MEIDDRWTAIMDIHFTQRPFRKSVRQNPEETTAACRKSLLWAWLAYLVLQQWLSPQHMGWLIAASTTPRWCASRSTLINCASPAGPVPLP